MNMFGSLSRFRDRVQRYFLSKTSDQEPVVWHERHRALMFVMLVAGIFLVTTTVHAASLTDLKDGVLNILGMIMGEIIAFMGKMIILLVSILISFASYNNFVHAQPVEIGWVLMRDVANMFFIVILLVSAFSTIIGYDEFKWNKVVPKLLLMAVLINFSKTLIGLLIDFSQVLMLTFVNAFRQAAGGNFVTALKLSKVTALAKDGDSPDTYEVSGGLIPAAILGIMMLGISMTLLVIMIGFIIFRIIGLWLLLIMSPMAFFALALPSKLSKALSAFTDSFWSRLSSLLIGGPVMAFFLWLALAVVQGSGGERAFADMYTETNEATSAASFVTEVGNAADIATFIVAVALMLAGVEFSVKTASAVSSSLGKFATAAAAGGGVAVTLARGAARVTRKGAAIGFEGVDRVADVRGLVGRAGLAASSKLGGVGAGTFAGLATAKPRREAAASAKFAESIKGLDTGTRLKLHEARGDAMKVAELSASGPGMKALAAEEKKKLASSGLKEEQQDVMAKGLAQRRAAEYIKAGKAKAKAVGDEEGHDKLDELIKKNPGLAANYGDLGDIKRAGVGDDVKAYIGGKSAAAFMDSASAAAIFAASGILDEGGNINVDGEAYKKLKESRGNKWDFAKEHLNYFSNNPEAYKTQLKAMQQDASDEVRAKAEQDRRFVDKDKSDKVTSVHLNQGGAAVNVAQTFAVKNEAEIEQQKTRLSQFRQQGAAENSDEVVSAKTAMAGAGASIVETFNFNAKDGTFAGTSSAESVANRDAFSQVMNDVSEKLARGDAQALSFIEKLDTDTLAANADNYNEARVAALAQFDPKGLLAGYQAAVDSGNKAAQRKIQELSDIMVAESKRVEKAADKGGISKLEIIEVATNPASEQGRQIAERMKEAGIGDPVASAKAVSKGWDIQSDPQMRTMRQGAIARVATGTRRASSSAGQSVGGAVDSFREKRKQAKENRRDRRVEKMEEDLLRRADKKGTTDKSA